MNRKYIAIGLAFLIVSGLSLSIVSDIQSENQELQQENNQLASELEEAKDENESLEQANSEVRESYRSAEKENRVLQRENNTLKEEKENLQKQLETGKASKFTLVTCGSDNDYSNDVNRFGSGDNYNYRLFYVSMDDGNVTIYGLRQEQSDIGDYRIDVSKEEEKRLLQKCLSKKSEGDSE